MSTTTLTIFGASVLVSLVLVLFALRRAGILGPRRRVLATGTPGTAVLLGIQPTGTVINEVTYVCRLQLRVQVPGAAPYDVEARDSVPITAMGVLVPGSVLAVRVDVSDPAKVFLDWDRGGRVAGPSGPYGAPVQPATSNPRPW